MVNRRRLSGSGVPGFQRGALGRVALLALMLGAGTTQAEARGLEAPVIEAAPNGPSVGADPARCQALPGRPDIRIRAFGFKNNEGQVQFALYGGEEKDFLAKGKKLIKILVPVNEQGTEVCISVPAAGNYALGVYHDINMNGKVNVPPEGGGFSNNPKVLFGPPSFRKVVFAVPQAGTELSVKMRYLFN